VRKISIAFIIIGVIVIGGYLFIRYALHTRTGFKPVNAQEAKYKPKKGETNADLRPEIIKKLQQLVKDGSHGLYNLSVHEVNPDIVKSTLDIGHVILEPDSAVIKTMEQTKKLPNDIFKLTIDSIHFDGIDIEALLAKSSISINNFVIEHPVMNMYHRSLEYNKTNSKDTSKFFLGIMKYMDKISIKTIAVHHAQLFDHNLTNKTIKKFDGIAVIGKDFLIDSSTQCDNSRYCFTKVVNLVLHGYSMITNDHLYKFKIGTVDISTDKQLVSLDNVQLQPIYNKKEFQTKIKHATQYYSISVPSVRFHKIDWWGLINGENFTAAEATVNNAKAYLYLDLSLHSAPVKVNGYPHQLLMTVPFPIDIKKAIINHLNLTYEEYHPSSGKSGSIYFDNINGSISNVTNIKADINKNGSALLNASCSFMHFIPIHANIKFDLNKVSTGFFTASLEVGKFDASKLNNITEPLSLFIIKRGEVESGHGDISADNYHGNGKVSIVYKDLHITPVKKDTARASGFKKKSVFSFIANKFVIKDENPSHGDLRQPEVSVKRDPKASFFNLIWKITLSGILKTTGIPEKYAN
jgi:hypothetical protein